MHIQSSFHVLWRLTRHPKAHKSSFNQKYIASHMYVCIYVYMYLGMYVQNGFLSSLQAL
jgi:hypothetical protein